MSKDTRTIRKDALYFSIRGENLDGQDCVGAAFDCGAAAGVVSRGWVDWGSGRKCEKGGGPLLVGDDTVRALRKAGSPMKGANSQTRSCGFEGCGFEKTPVRRALSFPQRVEPAIDWLRIQNTCQNRHLGRIRNSAVPPKRLLCGGFIATLHIRARAS